jgi:rubrerythrin
MTLQILIYFTRLYYYGGLSMSKTEDVIKALQENKDTATIKAETGASEALISRCRQKLKKEEPKKEEEEPEPTDEEIEAIITRIQVKPDEKYLTKDKDEKEEDYKCLGCGHTWKSSNMPLSCPNCGAEF